AANSEIRDLSFRNRHRTDRHGVQQPSSFADGDKRCLAARQNVRKADLLSAQTIRFDDDLPTTTRRIHDHEALARPHHHHLIPFRPGDLTVPGAGVGERSRSATGDADPLDCRSRREFPGREERLLAVRREYRRPRTVRPADLLHEAIAEVAEVEAWSL